MPATDGVITWMHWKNVIIVALALLVMLETGTIYHLHNKAQVARQAAEKEIEEAHAETRSAINNWSRMLDDCKKRQNERKDEEWDETIGRIKGHIDWLIAKARTCKEQKQGYCGGQ